MRSIESESDHRRQYAGPAGGEGGGGGGRGFPETRCPKSGGPSFRRCARYKNCTKRLGAIVVAAGRTSAPFTGERAVVEQMAAFGLLFVLTVLLAVVYRKLKDGAKRDAQLISKIPGPPAWPLLGNALSLNVDLIGICAYLFPDRSPRSLSQRVFEPETKPVDL